MTQPTINPPTNASSSCCEESPSQAERTWKGIFNGFLTPWSAIALIPLLVLLIDPQQFPTVVNITVGAFLGTLPFILFAVLMIGYLKATGAENVIAKIFMGRENRMIVFAAIFGGLAPFCSCEVIPFVAGLLAIGTPLSAVMAFWLASPLIDPPSLIITAGALGWPFAMGKAIIAICIGLTGGFVLKSLKFYSVYQNPLKNVPAGSGCCKVETSNKDPNWRFWSESSRIQIFRAESKANLIFLIKWLLLAYVLESLLILYVPAALIASVVGGEGLSSVVIGAAVGMPTYLNGYAAPALVAGLIEQGMNNGAAMAFMTAGAISSIPAMTAIWSLVKSPVFFTYLLIGFVGSVLFGSLFSLLV